MRRWQTILIISFGIIGMVPVDSYAAGPGSVFRTIKHTIQVGVGTPMLALGVIVLKASFTTQPELYDDISYEGKVYKVLTHFGKRIGFVMGSVWVMGGGLLTWRGVRGFYKQLQSTSE